MNEISKKCIFLTEIMIKYAKMSPHVMKSDDCDTYYDELFQELAHHFVESVVFHILIELNILYNLNEVTKPVSCLRNIVTLSHSSDMWNQWLTGLKLMKITMRVRRNQNKRECRTF